MVVAGWNVASAGQPGKNVGIGFIQKALEALELSFGHHRHIALGKAAKQDVALKAATVAAAVQQPLAAQSEWISGHRDGL